jgi:CysZ protein
VDLLAGLSYPLRALALINRTPRLWRFVVVPIIVNVVVGALLYLGLFAGIWSVVDDRINASFQGVLVAVLGALAAVVVAVTIGFVLVRFGVVLGAPWYGQLSEELEGMLTGHIHRPIELSAGLIAYDIWRALLFELKKLALLLTVWLLSLLLLLIPVAGGPIYAAVGFVTGAMLSCLDFFDGPQERRRRRFREKLATVRQLLPGSLSFGAVAFFLVSIPLVNLLAIPLMVTAGNMFVIERWLQPTQSAQTPGSPASGPAA